MKPTPFMGDRHDIVNVEPDDPAPGAILTWNVPANAVIQVVALSFLLTTSEDVVDRHVEVYVSDGGVSIPCTPAMVVQPEDTAWHYFFTIGIAPLDLSAGFSHVYQPLGCCYQIETGASLVVNVINIRIADEITVVEIRYFLWERA